MTDVSARFHRGLRRNAQVGASLPLMFDVISRRPRGMLNNLLMQHGELQTGLRRRMRKNLWQESTSS
jgi:hypothetical protein